MSDEELQNIYNQAWDTFDTTDHVETIMRRVVASGVKSKKIIWKALFFYGCHTIEGVHPLQGGLIRRKYRRERRPGMPLENPLIFYPRYLAELVYKHVRLLKLAAKFILARFRVERDASKRNYTDLALAPATDKHLDELEMFDTTASARVAAQKVRLNQAKRATKLAS